MKTMILAALAALSLGVGAASAQGVPAGGNFAAPQYGASAFSRDNHSLFSWSADNQKVNDSQARPVKAPRPAGQNTDSSSPTARGG